MVRMGIMDTGVRDYVLYVDCIGLYLVREEGTGRVQTCEGVKDEGTRVEGVEQVQICYLVNHTIVSPTQLHRITVLRIDQR